MKDLSGSVRTNENRRLHTIFVVFMIPILLIIMRMYYIQVVRHDELFKIREGQSLKTRVIPAERGIIYDREGIALAISDSSTSIWVDPSRIFYPQKTSEKLHKLTEVSESDILKKLNPEKRFVWVRRKMGIEIREKLDSATIEGAGYIMETKRFYPQNENACHILGFVGIDNQGLSGLEKLYDEILTGKDGVKKFYQDGYGKEIPSRIVHLDAAINGKPLHLTLCKSIQQTVESELRRYAFKYKIEEGIVIIMKAQNGEVLALANYPSYNPNNFSDYSTIIYERNGAIQELIEAKPMLFLIMTAVGIEKKGLNLENSFFGKYRMIDYFLWASKIDNNLLIMLSHDIGKELLSEYFQIFGIGQKTRISLPGESEGTYNLPMFLSDGQGILMTPLQMTKIMGIVVNDGIAVTPLILKTNPDTSENKEENSAEPNKVLLKGTSNALKQTLTKIVAHGDANDVHIDGYEIGGLGFPFLDTSAPNAAGAAFVGFVNENSSQEKLVIFAMTKIKRHNRNMEKRLKFTKDLFRAITYETLRYLESKSIERGSRGPMASATRESNKGGFPR